MPRSAGLWILAGVALVVPSWRTDAQSIQPAVLDISRQLAQVHFGVPWPDSVPASKNCGTIQALSHSLLPEDYWVYRCHSESPGGVRTDFIYEVPGRDRPTLERVRYALPAPARASVEQWWRIRSTLLDTLPRYVDSLGWVGRDTDQGSKIEGIAKDGTIGVELFEKSGTPAAAESLVVEYRSNWLVAQGEEEQWASEADRDDKTASAVRESIAALKVRRSNLATVLESTRASSEQIRTVRAELTRAFSPATESSERDLLLLAAHLWANRFAEILTRSANYGCPRSDTSLVHEFNTAFSREGCRIDCGNEGDWCYSGALIDSLAARASADRWADHALLVKMESGWTPPCGLCGWDSIGPDQFRQVIARGTAFLAAHPKSWMSPEIQLMIGEAHETAWSLSKVSPGNDCVDGRCYVAEAPAHRIKAIELYEAHLKSRPRDPRDGPIRRRLRSLRVDSDTGYQKYWCLWD